MLRDLIGYLIVCVGGGGVAAAVTNMKKKGTGLKNVLGRGLLSGQNGGPWDKTS